MVGYTVNITFSIGHKNIKRHQQTVYQQKLIKHARRVCLLLKRLINAYDILQQ